MLWSRTYQWVSGWYLSTSQFPKDMHILRLEVKIGKTESWRNTYRGVNPKRTRFVPGEFSCTNSSPSCSWQKVVDGYNRNIFSLPKHNIRISRVFVTLVRPNVRNTGCYPLFFTTPRILLKSNSIKTMLWGPSRHLGSLTAANWVSFDFNVSYSSCW